MNKSKLTIEESLNKIKFMMNYDSSKTLTEQLEYNGQRLFGPSSREQLQKYFQDLRDMFDYAETYKSQLNKIPRGVDDKQIDELSKRLYSTMQGIGLNKKPVAEIFESLQSASDFIALNDSFNATYGAKQDLYTWIINEMGMGVKVQQRILTSLRNLMAEAAKSAKTDKENPQQPIDIQKPEPITGPVDNLNPPVDNINPPTAQYPFSKGTDDDPYRYGTRGSGIAQVQQNLGLKQDGKWGPKTDVKIKELAPEFANGFTNQNLSQVIQKVRGQVNPTAVNTRNIKPSINVAPSQNTAQLAGQPTKLA